MKSLFILIFIIFSIVLFGQEEKRLALVIGNANYDKGALKNPVNDAELMKETLEKLNFNVIYDINLEEEEELEDIIIEFGKKRREYNVGFVYYAGHGIQLNGDNYLLPTKEIFNCEDDIRNNGVNVQTIMQYLKSTTNTVNVLVLDACRNNPLENRNCPNSSRSLNDGGLAKIVAPTGSLIAFSTSANTTAADGNSDNSIYCKSLAKNLLVPDKTLSQIFQNVRVDVLNQSKNEGRTQEPEEASKLKSDYYLIKTERFDLTEKLRLEGGDSLYYLFKQFLEKQQNIDDSRLKNEEITSTTETILDNSINNEKIIEKVLYNQESKYPDSVFYSTDLKPLGIYNDIVSQSYYSLSYSEDHEQAEWVYYELNSNELNFNVERKDNFRPDPKVITSSAQLYDYKGSGYDRGHLAPAADMKYNSTSMSESFLMSNMSPQSAPFNRGIWRKIEMQFRLWSYKYGKLVIVTGPVLNGSNYSSIGPNKVTIPKWYYKVAIDPDNYERNIAILIENQGSSKKIKTFAVTIDYLEKFSGIDFFPNLPDSIEESVENTTHTDLWDWK